MRSQTQTLLDQMEQEREVLSSTEIDTDSCPQSPRAPETVDSALEAVDAAVAVTEAAAAAVVAAATRTGALSMLTQRHALSHTLPPVITEKPAPPPQPPPLIPGSRQRFPAETQHCCADNSLACIWHGSVPEVSWAAPGHEGMAAPFVGPSETVAIESITESSQASCDSISSSASPCITHCRLAANLDASLAGTGSGIGGAVDFGGPTSQGTAWLLGAAAGGEGANRGQSNYHGAGAASAAAITVGDSDNAGDDGVWDGPWRYHLQEMRAEASGHAVDGSDGSVLEPAVSISHACAAAGPATPTLQVCSMPRLSLGSPLQPDTWSSSFERRLLQEDGEPAGQPVAHEGASPGEHSGGHQSRDAGIRPMPTLLEEDEDCRLAGKHMPPAAIATPDPGTLPASDREPGDGAGASRAGLAAQPGVPPVSTESAQSAPRTAAAAAVAVAAAALAPPGAAQTTAMAPGSPARPLSPSRLASGGCLDGRHLVPPAQGGDYDWRLGNVSRPLERLMFGESQSQRASSLCGAMMEDMLDTLSQQEECQRIFAVPTPLVSGAEARVQGMPAEANIAPTAVNASSSRPHKLGQRSVGWFVVRNRGGEDAFLRLPVEDEEKLTSALESAHASLRPVRARRGVPTAAYAAARSAALYQALRNALGTEDIGALRCAPLDGELARSLPLELLCPGVRVAHLPAAASSGGRFALAGAALQRAKASVEGLLRDSGPAVFKVGITCNPPMRWRAYERDGYAGLHLVFGAEDPGAVQMMEAALIDAFRGRLGCRNIARGGEGPVGRGPFFTYLALAPCGEGVGVAVGMGTARKRGRQAP